MEGNPWGKHTEAPHWTTDLMCHHKKNVYSVETFCSWRVCTLKIKLYRIPVQMSSLVVCCMYYWTFITPGSSSAIPLSLSPVRVASLSACGIIFHPRTPPTMFSALVAGTKAHWYNELSCSLLALMLAHSCEKLSGKGKTEEMVQRNSACHGFSPVVDPSHPFQSPTFLLRKSNQAKIKIYFKPWRTWWNRKQRVSRLQSHMMSLLLYLATL